jgi:protein-disulfide isomerase
MSLGTRIITPPETVPAGANSERDGIRIGDGRVTVDAYIDFLCPFCRMFEESSGEALDAMVGDGAITLVYHPLGFLDRLSTTAYSSRAAAASGCASDSGAFRAYARALFANQPPEGGPGLSQDELIALGAAVGIRAPAFQQCVRAEPYLPWVAYVTERAIERGVSGTPSVFVAGTPVPANADVNAAAVGAVG